MLLNADIISTVQTSFLSSITQVFHSTLHYANELLYFFVVFELILFGLAWAAQQTPSFENLFFKILKIGLLVFILRNYTALLNMLLLSSFKMSQSGLGNKSLQSVMLDPAYLWQYGYNAGIQLLHSAALDTGFGLPLIEIILGMSILFLFALLGIQIVIQMMGFYLIALAALILIPLGSFTPSRDFFAQGVHAVLKATIRLMVLMIVISLALFTWQHHSSHAMDLNQALGLNFSALLFLLLAIKLPIMASNTVGKLEFASNTSNYVQNEMNFSSVMPSPSFATHSVSLQVDTQLNQASHLENESYSTHHTSHENYFYNLEKTKTVFEFSEEVNNIANKSISDETLKKLKKVFSETLQEYNKKIPVKPRK